MAAFQYCFRDKRRSRLSEAKHYIIIRSVTNWSRIDCIEKSAISIEIRSMLTGNVTAAGLQEFGEDYRAETTSNLLRTSAQMNRV